MEENIKEQEQAMAKDVGEILTNQLTTQLGKLELIFYIIALKK